MVERILIYLTPSQEGTAWFHAIVEECKRQHIQCIEQQNGAQSVESENSSCIVVAWCGEDFSGFDDVVAIVPSVEASLSDAIDVYGVESADVIRRASETLAWISSLAERGVSMLSSASMRHHIPKLGTVERGEIAIAKTKFPQSPALEMYSTIPPQCGNKAVWPVDLLFVPGSPPRVFEGGVVDMTGRARLIAFGPFISLPAGRWGLKFELDVDCDDQRLDLELEWGTSESLGSVSTKISRDGAYSVSLVGEWLSSAPAQLRIWLRKSSFSGRIRLGEMICERLNAPAPAVPKSDLLAIGR